MPALARDVLRRHRAAAGRARAALRSAARGACGATGAAAASQVPADTREAADGLRELLTRLGPAAAPQRRACRDVAERRARLLRDRDAGRAARRRPPPPRVHGALPGLRARRVAATPQRSPQRAGVSATTPSSPTRETTCSADLAAARARPRGAGSLVQHLRAMAREPGGARGRGDGAARRAGRRRAARRLPPPVGRRPALGRSARPSAAVVRDRVPGGAGRLLARLRPSAGRSPRAAIAGYATRRDASPALAGRGRRRRAAEPGAYGRRRAAGPLAPRSSCARRSRSSLPAPAALRRPREHGARPRGAAAVPRPARRRVPLSLPPELVFGAAAQVRSCARPSAGSCPQPWSSAATRSASRRRSGRWFHEPRFLERFRELLLDPDARTRGLLKPEAVERDLAAGRWRDADAIWRALNAELWLRELVPAR